MKSKERLHETANVAIGLRTGEETKSLKVHTKFFIHLVCPCCMPALEGLNRGDVECRYEY